ncbi:MAG: 30S ribosomal protein S6 [bacterium]
MNTYELTYIIPVKNDNEDISAIQSRVEAILVNSGAKKLDIENDFTSSKKKKLGYEIDKFQYGYYTTIYFEASADAISTISKTLKMDGSILRYLIISVKGEIPQGVVVSKKEVEQQVDNFVEKLKEEEKNIEKEKTVLVEKMEEAGAKAEKEEEQEKNKSKKAQPKKASLEELDEKLDEILGDK